LRPGPAPEAAAVPDLPDTTASARDQAFLLSAVRSATARPVVIVYAPCLPRMADGAVSFTDPDREGVARFAALCRAQGIGFLDATPAFGDGYRACGRFPHGFANGVPGQGHLNPEGCRELAAALCAYLEEHPVDGLHAD
jgi:hypothetical protein